MVRIHFTAADLARTHVAAEPDPFWELVLSLHVLQGEYRLRSYPEWRRTLPQGDERHRFNRVVRSTLVPVAPAGPYFPDFVTPIEGLAGFDAGLQAVLSTPRPRLRSELAQLSPAATDAGWIADLADARAPAVRRLGETMRWYYQQALVPYWPTIQTRIRSEFLLRSRLYADQGVTGLLSSLGPLMSWRSPVLEIRGPGQRDIHLNGRGLTLIPSYFNCHNPMTLADPDLPPIVIYPAARLGELLGDAETGPALSGLLGGTRAAVLKAVETPRTTSELAAEIAMSRATASEHATVLRRAGLINTQRHGLAVWHTLTPLGAMLLKGY